jgi:phosphocarrier protein HPr
MTDTHEREVKVLSPNGLHARPSHAVVAIASEFDAKVSLDCQGRVADARSILSVMTLGATEGDMIRLSASGAEATQVLDKLAQYFADAFEEGGA